MLACVTPWPTCVFNTLTRADLPAYLMPAPHLPHARRQQEHQEAGRRHHRCACPPSDVLGRLKQSHAGVGDEESEEEEDDKGESEG